MKQMQKRRQEAKNINTLTLQIVLSASPKQLGGNSNDIRPSSTGLHVTPEDGTEINFLLGLATTANIENLLIHAWIIGTRSFSSYRSTKGETQNQLSWINNMPILLLK